MRRVVLALALAGTAALPAAAHAAVDICATPNADTRVCTDTGRPGCVWGWANGVGFITTITC